jgi:site-specific recombinase XerD
MRFIEFRVPAAIELVRRVRAIPFKTARSRLVCFLTSDEWQAMINAAAPTTTIGTRNRALLLLAVTSGLRASELVRLAIDDVSLHAQPTLHVVGKGRRERVLPLWSEATKALAAWFRVRPTTSAREVFLSTRGRPISRAAFAAIVHEHARRAAEVCPSIGAKRVTPHVLRHTCAMIVLQATGDIRKVALWLGHAVLKSTDPYVRADPTEKLELLAHAMPLSLRRGRFRAPDDVLSFLKAKAIC